MQTEFTFNRGAVRPVQCLSGGWQLLRGSYGSFLGVVIVGILIMMAGSCVPLAPLNAPVMCGIYLCLLARLYNQPINTGVLFKGFQYFLPAFIASLFVSVPMFVLGLVFQFGMGGFQIALQNMKIDDKTPPEQVIPIFIGFFGYIFGGVLVIMLVGMVLNAMMIFVYPLIVERKLGGLDAVKLGFRAVLGNFVGVFIYTILEILIILAGVMLFYIGALLVLPVIFAARVVAYRQVFPAPSVQTNPDLRAGAPPQQMWTPQMITSKAGWYLTASALIILALGITGIVGLSLWSYTAITEAVKKVQQQQRDRQSDYYPTPSSSPYKSNSNSSRSDVETIDGEVLNDKAVELPTPVYPPAAKAVRASGKVAVKVTINAKGEVTSADAVSGHPLLKASAAAAARRAKFKPNAGETKGILTYDFTAPS